MRKFGTKSLSKRLFCSFIISFLLPMVLISGLVSYLYTARQHQQINNQTLNNLKLISAYITKYINDIDNISKAPYYHSYFQSKTLVSQLSPYEQNTISAEIGKLLQLTAYSREDFGDMLVMSDEQVLYFNSADWYQYLPTVNPLVTRLWYSRAIEQGGRVAIVPVEQQPTDTGVINTESFYISRKLNNIFFAEQTNVIMVNLKTDALDSLFAGLTSEVPLMIMFTNNHGELIYSNTEVTAELVASLNEPRLDFNRRGWTNYTQRLESYPLTVHLLLDSSYVWEQIATFMLVMLLCYGVGIGFAYLLFRRNNRWIQLPTYHIKATLGELEKGNLTSRCKPLPVTEFNEIGMSVNTMAHQLQERIKNEYELRIAQKSLQLRALQSQIQPHFIINTIYSFITLNQIGEHEVLNDAFYSFARMLRYVLSREDGTTIGKELDFLRDYCSLCLLRFGNRLSYTVECEQQLEQVALPKLLLQPLVENAVIHGVEPSETPCTLTVQVTQQGDTIRILIVDDGVGFTQEQLNAPDSIGIKNVENRLHLLDENAQLTICRKEGKTIQELLLPMV